MKTLKTLLTLTVLAFTFLTTVAQDDKTAKKSYSQAKKYLKNNQLNDAITGFTLAISMDKNYTDAYIGRAQAYEFNGNIDKATLDYKTVFTLLPAGDKQLKELYFKAGVNLSTMQQYKEAIEMFDKALAMNKTYLTALQERAFCKFKLKDFTGAVEDCDKAIAEKSSDHVSYFYKAMAVDSLSSFQLAEMLYQKAIAFMLDQKSKNESIDPFFKPYYVNLGTVQKKLNKLDDAMKNYNAALALDNKDDNILYLRGLVYFLKSNYDLSIADFTSSIVNNDKNANAFLERGYSYKKLGQFENAVNDFTRSIVLFEKEPRAYIGRGGCNFELAKYSLSLKDFERASLLSPNDKEVQGLYISSKQKIYEINRESNIPTIVLLTPENDTKNRVNIPDNMKEMVFTGKIKDESVIKSIKIDGIDADFDPEIINPSFKIIVPVSDKRQLSISATDAYNNNGVEIFSVNKTETLAPLVNLTSPASTPDRDIYLSNNNPNVFFEGQIADSSHIKSITVDGLNAAFDPNVSNPVFNTNLNILNKDTIKIVATDIFGNTGEYKYYIDRKASESALTNPMGRTWVVFINNSNYQNLPVLQGAVADVTKIRTALSAYRVDKVIEKKDMSKKDMEKFFSIELRDQLRDNFINSVVIWYSGHGKFMNDVGYWLPVDVLKEDEFTYYSLNNLKASLQAYKNVQHHLVISDACETGPAFYLAMRSSDTPKSCGQWDIAKFKSAQVLTSSNTEKSSDNSIFANTFAAALTGNPDQCITIENIADKVKISVKKNQAQTPKFGNINGVVDEGGTFFFIKK